MAPAAVGVAAKYRRRAAGRRSGDEDAAQGPPVASHFRAAGFVYDPGRGKGSHGWWAHRTGVKVSLAGKSGDDAKPYQEKDVREAIAQTRPREAETKEQQS